MIQRLFSPKNARIRLLLTIDAMWGIAFMTSLLFVSTYILKVSESLHSVAIYYLALFITVPLVGLYIAPACKAGCSSRLMSIGLALQFVYFSTLYLLGDRVSNHLIGIGVLFGISCAFYCIPIGLYILNMKSVDEKLKYVSINKGLGAGLGMIVPPILGWLIWRFESYGPVFLLLAVALLIACILSSFLKEENFKPRTELDLAKFYRLAVNSPPLRRMFGAFILSGLSLSGSLRVLVTLTIFRYVGNELGVGIVSSFAPIMGIIVAIVLGKLSTTKHSSIAIHSALVMTIALALLVGTEIWISLILFLIVYQTATPALDIIFHSYCYNISEIEPEVKAMDVEYIMLKEVGLAIGRFVSYGLVFILSALSPATWIWSILLLILAVAVIGMAYYLKPAEPCKGLAVSRALQTQATQA